MRRGETSRWRMEMRATARKDEGISFHHEYIPCIIPLHYKPCEGDLEPPKPPMLDTPCITQLSRPRTGSFVSLTLWTNTERAKGKFENEASQLLSQGRNSLELPQLIALVPFIVSAGSLEDTLSYIDKAKWGVVLQLTVGGSFPLASFESNLPAFGPARLGHCVTLKWYRRRLPSRGFCPGPTQNRACLHKQSILLYDAPN